MNISDDVLLKCPERRFNWRKAKYCLDCKYYGGFSSPTVNGKPVEDATIEQYQIVCKRPITRHLTEMESD